MNLQEQKRYFREKEGRIKRLSKDSGELYKERQITNEVAENIDIGDGRAEILAIQIFGEQGQPVKKIAIGEKLKVVFKANIHDTIESPVAFVGFHKLVEQHLFEMNTSRQKKMMIKTLHKGDQLEVIFFINNKLLPGEYSVWVHLGDPNIYGKGTGDFAALIKNFYKIKVYDPHPSTVPEWSGIIFHYFKYQVKITK